MPSREVLGQMRRSAVSLGVCGGADFNAAVEEGLHGGCGQGLEGNAADWPGTHERARGVAVSAPLVGRRHWVGERGRGVFEFTRKQGESG